MSASTANGLLKVLRVAFAPAEADGVISKNEARLVKKLKADEDAAARRAFTLPELKRVLAQASDEWRSMVLFGFYTGARLGDLALLTWQNVDLQTQTLHLVMRKTGGSVVIPLAEHVLSLPAGNDPKQPLHPHAYDVMTRTHQRTEGAGPRVGNVGRLSNEFHDILEAAGLVKARDYEGKDAKHKGKATRRETGEMGFHCLRHTAVSLLKNAGVSDAVARDLVGHESAEINRHYTHIADEPKRAAVNKLPRIE